MRLAFLLLLLPASLLVGCGTDTIKQKGAEKSVGDVVYQGSGFRPKDVKCPSDVEAKVGKTFDCHFTGPEPKPYVAHVRITKIDGASVSFVVRSVPAG